MARQPQDTPSFKIISVDSPVNRNFLREGLRLLVQSFIEFEIADVIEAAPHERSSNRRSYRNGYRRRTWLTSLGELDLEIPKLRKGSYYPAFFDTLRQNESILLGALHKVFENGVMDSDVKKMVQTMGFSVNHPDQIADLVEQLYDLVDRFRDKPRVQVRHNLIDDRPVNAISTHLLDSQLPDPPYRPRSLLEVYTDEWLSESLTVLIRLRQALSHQSDAVAA
jgi:hypothetical protein